MAAARNRYPERVIADRIEAVRREREVSVEDAAEAAGMGHWSWYKKADGTTPFKVDEIGRIASFFSAPPGWPFIEWSAGLFLERELGKAKP